MLKFINDKRGGTLHLAIDDVRLLGVIPTMRSFSRDGWCMMWINQWPDCQCTHMRSFKLSRLAFIVSFHSLLKSATCFTAWQTQASYCRHFARLCLHRCAQNKLVVGRCLTVVCWHTSLDTAAYQIIVCIFCLLSENTGTSSLCFTKSTILLWLSQILSSFILSVCSLKCSHLARGHVMHCMQALRGLSLLSAQMV